MKIAVECKSPLLQKSLELFLARYLSSSKKSDIVVRDVACLNDERCFYISGDENADLVKPFSKSQLILALENRYKTLYKNNLSESEYELSNEPVNFDILEKRIEYLTSEYQKNILRAIRAFYEE
jgi:hypothetical protein